jgi:hypothetical protein
LLHLGRVFQRARENSLEKDRLDNMLSPEHTPLKESRRIYRSHRQMRIGILEASRRFEEKKRAKEDEETSKPTLTLQKTPPRQRFLATIPGSHESSPSYTSRGDVLPNLPNRDSDTGEGGGSGDKKRSKPKR